MKKSKSKKFLIRRIIAIVVVFFVILSLRNLMYHFYLKQQTKQTRVLLNNDFIELSNNIYVENSVIYISEEDVKNIFDHTIYYNVGDKELITTFNKHVAVLHLNEKKMLVNDSILQTQGILKEIDTKIYLPMTDLEIVYDIEIQYAENTNMVIMNSTTKKKSQVMALKDAKIKRSKLPFAIPIEKVKRGDYLYVLENDGNYKKVRTNAGNIGYIKTRKVSDEELIREDWVEEKLEASDFEDISDLLMLTKEKIEITSISTAFATYSERSKIINKLYDEVMQNEYHGICVNFEEIDDVNSFIRFLVELTPKFKESGLKVIVQLNDQLEEEKVKDIVDFTR